MSTIAYRAGVLAADTMAYGGRYTASPGAKWKIWRLANGDRIGVSSSIVGAGERLRDWFALGPDRPAMTEPPSAFHLVLVTAAGEVFIGMDSVHLSGPIDGEYFAVGGGADYALGAMAMGATAEKAVRIASQFDQFTGGEIRALRPEPADDPA